MIAMSALDLFPAADIDTKRSTEKRRFDVMRDDGVASKDHLHIVTTNQVRDITTCSCMDDCRAQHEENLTVMRTSLFHLASDLMNCEYLDLLGGDGTLHESKRFTVSGTLKRLHANAIMSNHHLFTNLHFVHRPNISAMIGLIEHDSDIHLDIFYVY